MQVALAEPGMAGRLEMPAGISQIEIIQTGEPQKQMM